MATLDSEHIIIALLLTLFAGGCTGIGAILSFFTKRDNTKILSGALGLSAGVMVYISFMEMLPHAQTELTGLYGEKEGMWWLLAAFFGGIALIALIDKFIPEDENPHEMHTLSELSEPGNHHTKLKRTGTMLAIAIGIHNFPEGMATFISALDGIDVALPIVIAIAIHNIPEGIAVSVPIYQATGNRKKAFTYSLLTGLSEPIGAIVGMAILLPLWSPLVNALCLAIVAGIMIYISFDELLPSSERHGHHHIAIIGVITGMALMGVTLIAL